MLDEILNDIHNYFVVGTHRGAFSVKDGNIVLPFLLDGQYFRISGSALNDGVYKYPGYGEIKYDEDFTGEIWRLAIPKDFLKIVEEIEKFCEENKDGTPFVSESWGGYTYTKATDKNGAPISWQTKFAARLNRWRKI